MILCELLCNFLQWKSLREKNNPENKSCESGRYKQATKDYSMKGWRIAIMQITLNILHC
jgi:hypothetical protein